MISGSKSPSPFLGHQTHRVVVSSSGDGKTAQQQPIVRKTVTLTAAGPSPTATSKEGVYLVTLPQGHQLTRQGQNIVVMNRPTPAAANPVAADQTSSPSTPTLTTPNESPAKTNEHSASASPTSQTDRRNVAEILASLSGLMPEPPQNLEATSTPGGVTITPIVSTSTSSSLPNAASTTSNDTRPRATAAILSNPVPQASSTRVVRVLQASKPNLSSAKSSTTVVVTPATSGSGSSGRSRKQVFVTAKSVTTSLPASVSISPPAEDPSSRDPMPGNEEERDILEEDLNDLPYVPYPKIGAQPGRGRGRPPKGPKK